jgi:hypothetical protein
LTEVDASLGGGHGRDDQSFERYELEHGAVIGRYAGLVGCERRDHRVDDQLAEVRHAGWQQAGQQRQRSERQGQRSVRGPDERDRAAAIPPEPQIMGETRRTFRLFSHARS